MKFVIAAVAISVSALFGSVATSGMTLVYAPPPDVRLFLPVPHQKLGGLRRVLMNFAAQEHLSEFRNAPRGKGKQFFLSLNSDKLSFIAEKTAESRSVTIECYDIDSDYNRAQAKNLGAAETPFDIAVKRLKQQLKYISPDISEER